MNKGNWKDVFYELPECENGYLCYVVNFTVCDDYLPSDLQMTLYWTPDIGWLFPANTEGRVKYWQDREKNPPEYDED